MKSPAHDVAIFIAGKSGLGSLGGTTDWRVGVGSEPTSPPNAITLYDTGGPGPDTDQMDEFEVTFQVRVRCTLYSDGYQRHVDIKNLLIYDTPLVMDTSIFSGIEMTTEPQSLGRDDGDRDIIVANYRGRRTAKE